MYRTRLPMLEDRLFLTDGGLETTLIFIDGIELPGLAAFPLVETEQGRERLLAYFRTYTEIAKAARAGFVLESPTWRASGGWGQDLGYTPADLDRVNRESIELLEEIRRELLPSIAPCVVSGCIGPRGDGYAPDTLLTADEAERYHTPQIESFAATTADLVTAMTLTHTGEAIGIARAARRSGMPCVLSFTVETDGALPSGEPLGEAIERVDAATSASPAYYMINCAHPTHFSGALLGGAWTARVRGLRANASCMSHEELDSSTALDDGDPIELGSQYAQLVARLPHMAVLGGCCGTDHRHVLAIAGACAKHYEAPTP